MTRYADIYAASVLNMLYYPTFYMFRAPAMLLPHESTVSHEKQADIEAFSARPHNSQGAAATNGSNKRTPPLSQVASGQEPGHTHDMDDDDFDQEEQEETTSEQSN